MKRRDFIKNSTITVCLSPLFCGCKMINDTSNLPSKVGLDLCNMCQLNCVKCYMRENEDLVRKKVGFGYVDFTTFKNFVDKNPTIKEIETSNDGEIFLNPDLDKIIKYAYKKNIRLTANNGVNLNTLSEETAENLVKYQFKSMTISIDSATPETYVIYRRGGDFNTVINNIKRINHFKQKYNSKFPILTYKFILFGHNEHEIEQAKKLAQQLNMEINYEINYAPEYSPVKNIQRVKELTGKDVENTSLKSYYNNYKNNKAFSWFYCESLFKEPKINIKGDLVGCCYLFLDSFRVNVFKDGLIKALNSKNVVYAKKMLTDLSVPPIKDIPCTQCPIYIFLRDNNLTLKKS